MKLGGFQPFTLTDFPGRAAAIVFTQGCNFRCPFCHNIELIPAKPSLDEALSPESIIEFLGQRVKQLDGVVITGGEPCIQQDLPAFCLQLKALDFDVKVDTNGSRPEVVRQLMKEALVDFIAMDIKAPLESYSMLSGVDISTETIVKSIEVIASSNIPHLFRTTFVKPLLTEQDADKIIKLVPSGSRHVFQEFRPERVLRPDILPGPEVIP